jgi:hypothetical protein
MLSKQRAPRRSAAQWQKIMTEFSESDLTQNQFCKQKGLAKSTFSKWFSRLRDDQPVENDLLLPISDCLVGGSEKVLELNLNLAGIQIQIKQTT